MFKTDDEVREIIASNDPARIMQLFDGFQYDSGRLENRNSIENLSRFCGRLVSTLIDKKILTTEEVEILFCDRQ